MRIEGVGVAEQRLDMVRAVKQDGLSVTEVCQLWGVSRQTYYVWERRYEAEGVDGLADRSSRPRSSPRRIQANLESFIVELRQTHPRWGARRIKAELTRRGRKPPSKSTIHTVLVRNGLVRPLPREPKANLRFERDSPNELWQTDAKEVPLANGTIAQVISVLDDHSRLCCAVDAFAELAGEHAVSLFDDAARAWGLPFSVLADRGVTFTGRGTNTVVRFERHLWARGVLTINGRPYHPQTQGKIERYHRTLGEWLDDQGSIADLAALRSLLVLFQRDYNECRPHQGIDDMTPLERWSASAPRGPAPELTADRRRRESIRSTGANGNLYYGEWVIGLGRAMASSKVRVVDLAYVIEIYAGDQLVRSVIPDHTRSYLGTGLPRGRHRPPT
jgi:transposase InsO family protein